MSSYMTVLVGPASIERKGVKALLKEKGWQCSAVSEFDLARVWTAYPQADVILLLEKYASPQVCGLPKPHSTPPLYDTSRILDYFDYC